jgi:outer membrane receptor protein involved in Fe transport
MVPQLHISQHSGSGKGHQIFLRGFDCEHGDNLALYLEGVPLNEPSHVHGIGYTDLHFLIPAAVERMAVIKGPYDARNGDFSTAGAVNFVLKERLKRSYVSFGGGSFRTMEGTLAFSPGLPGINAMVALQGFTTRGFTAFGKWKGLRGLAKVTRRLGKGKLSIIAAAYASDWKAADALPQRLVDADEKDFFGGMDSSDGGASARQHLSAHYRVGSRRRGLVALAYLYRRRTSIFTNYTYFLKHPDHGDQTEQNDLRWVSGARAMLYRRWELGWLQINGVAGGGWRMDDIDLALYRTEDRQRWDRGAEVKELVHNLSVFGKAELRFSSWVRLVLGARYDYFLFDVHGVMDFLLPSGAIQHDQAVDGTRGLGVWSPKASLVVNAHRSLAFFLNYGMGFHSPDARDPVLNSEMTIPTAQAAEAGVRYRLHDYVDVAGAFWSVYLERDTFFDPTLGRSVDTGSTRRLGGELEVRGRVGRWLYLYLDGSYTDARHLDSNDPVIGSPTWLAQTGGVVRWQIRGGPRPLRGSTLRGGMRLRYVGARYLAEGRKAEDALLGDVLLDWDTRYFGVRLSVANLWNVEWKDAQYYYTSRASLNEPLAGVTGNHFTAGAPFEAKATVRLYLP